MTGRLVTAGLLTADTLASLNAAQERRSDFILVPESSAGSTPATARSIGGAPLPQVRGWLGGGCAAGRVHCAHWRLA